MSSASTTNSAIVASGTIDVSPSLQIRKTSPSAAVSVKVSTSTSGSGPERARDDRSLRVLLRLLLGQAALAQQLLDERVVLGHALEPAVAQQVGAAVADVGEGDLARSDVGRRQRRAHAGSARVALGERVDLRVGLLHRAFELALRAVASSPGGRR